MRFITGKVLALILTITFTTFLSSCSKSIHQAAYGGDINAVKVLIAEGADINALDEKGCTALAIAAQAGNFELVKILVESGADVNKPVTDNASAVASALSEITKMVNTEGALSYNPIFVDKNEISYYFSANGIDLTSYGFEYTNVLDEIYKSYEDIAGIYVYDTLSSEQLIDLSGTSALVAASIAGSLLHAKYLIDSGVAVTNLAETNYSSALEAAKRNKHTKIAEYLIQNGAIEI
jgi:ankyrin repeat protein